ncbi:hypothetical protein GGS26DRAFT_543341 [Hypomontagnella submonticulosa]|nr:hypothetical protein GGS26DRAFT_543341 [Hypomontagnella submonticulosa]
MDKLASILLAFPPGLNLFFNINDNAVYDGTVKAHLAKLSKLLREHNTDLVAHGPNLLAVLDPEVNSLSYLAVLHSLIVPGIRESTPRDLVLEKLVIFLTTFDARQSRYAGRHLLDVFHAAGSGQFLPPSVAVHVLSTAILRLDPTGSMLTSSHILLAKLAYQTNNVIPPVLEVFDKDIVFYPNMANHKEPGYLCDLTLSPPSYISPRTGLTNALRTLSVLEYDLLCGMAHCSMREWAKAYTAFERVVTFPTREGGVSKVMVEVYKKWVLVSLLAKGKLAELPSYTGAQATKLYGSSAKLYTEVATVFVGDDAGVLKAEVEKSLQQWEDDGNMGLIQEVLAAYQKWQVLRLQQIYSKVSLSEIRQQTTSAKTGAKLRENEDVEALVQNMIISGMLNGVIEKNDDGTVFLTFLPSAIKLSEEQFARELANTAFRLKELHPIFKETKERLGTSKEYIKYVIKEDKRVEKNDTDPTLGFEAHVDDEDLMGGVVATG